MKERLIGPLLEYPGVKEGTGRKEEVLEIIENPRRDPKAGVTKQ